MHSVSRVPQHSRRLSRDPVKNMSLYHCMTFFHWSSFGRCFVHNKLNVKFVHSSNHTEHYIKQLSYLTLTKRKFTLAQCIFKWNIPVNGHKQRTFGLPHYKPLPRSNTNSTVTVCTLAYKGYDSFVFVVATSQIGPIPRHNSLLSLYPYT